MSGRRAVALAACLGIACAWAPREVSRHTLPELGPGDTDPALGLEPLPLRSAATLLPPELLAGPQHRVHDEVGSDGFLHLYRVESGLGDFEVAGDELLRAIS